MIEDFGQLLDERTKKKEQRTKEQIMFPAHVKDNNAVVEILMKKQQRG